MADVTFGVKVTPELEDKIKKMIEVSGFKKTKEWFEHLLSIYEVHQLHNEDGTRRYTDDLTNIQQHITRIQETIAHTVKKSADEFKQNEEQWRKSYDELQQQLQISEETRNTLNNQLNESVVQTNQLKNALEELKKQFSVHETLNSTLTNALKDKESEIETLRNDRNQWNAFNYPTEIQRLKEENQQLQQEMQKHQHEMVLLRMEYDHKLEIERLKAAANFNAERNQFNVIAETDLDASVPRKRGRPRKDSTLSVSGLQQPPSGLIVQIENNKIAEHEDDPDEDLYDDQEAYVPDSYEYLQDLQNEESTDDDQLNEEQPEHKQDHIDET